MSSRAGGVIVALLVTVLALAIVAAAGIGWYYSGEILGPDKPSTLEEQRVITAGADRIELSRDLESVEPGRWYLQWADGYGALGDLLETTDSSVVRVFHPVVGTPPVGRLASIKGVSRSADPQTMLGIPFEEVQYSGELGYYPAWLIAGTDSIWVILVHGRAARPSEALRTIEAIGHRGMPELAITYRNDAGAPRSKDGWFHLGQDEWRDLESAARWAVGQGARGLIVVGYSMGGQIVMQFVANSKDMASYVRGVVLESPVLNWSATLDYQTKRRGLPTIVTRLGELVTTWRAGLSWDGLDRVRHAKGMTTPVLLFHNVPDRETPIAISESLAAELPAVVHFVRIEHGNHVEAWNADHDRYVAELNAWLDARGAGRPDSLRAN